MKKYILMLCTALVVMSCSKEEAQPQEDQKEEVSTSILKLTDAQLKNFDIDTVSFQHQNLPTTIRLNAKTAVTPENTISITNAFGGYVKQIALIPGNYVNKGQVLVVLEDPQYIQMQEDYLTTKALLEQANADYIRQKELNAEQAASDKVMQQAKATRQSLMVKKSSLEQKLRLMNINPSSVSLSNIRRTINVYAPISGMVSQVFANKGQYISPADAMLEIINPDRSLLNVKVFEKDLGNIQIGQTLKAYTNTKPDQKLDAKITSISNQVNEDGTVDIFAKITNANGTRLTANMYFNIELEVNSLDANVLPEEAIVQFEGKDYVFERQNKNQFRLVPVEIGISSNKMVEIKSPQNSNKVYIAKGSYNLLNAMKNEGEEE
ncbi:efflux RND transporter periplasmic adaptor subunit [Empedobacter stercoris]|uniref:efflux RND transporter periplasmic adaptor subunit n=1 Tax=Empedobacter TaxID=59734 RepID=UPI001662351F|nr:MULTISPECIES: efflux RND transporter periplasmic adaptor subunit [Empedobacter]HJD86511.1 efflux RND transporter periplasmic adaptor subunit [Empedobacter falsenii]MCA4809049.1 efflux RND transporter periplasmic adaptor subunit [Empedobacter stercoris]MDM1522016.1 efflux RND transporter periplasmic adaptor subunit [Empedobacter sp. 225-1]MDM1542285.1 efflux RND transporter periplasmic adaptor subunit [Empedobacter sp. 189-2]QNT14183.1 efflux RND transporter periplasmic adaptor subunit [Empe